MGARKDPTELFGRAQEVGSREIPRDPGRIGDQKKRTTSEKKTAAFLKKRCLARRSRTKDLKNLINCRIGESRVRNCSNNLRYRLFGEGKPECVHEVTVFS